MEYKPEIQIIDNKNILWTRNSQAIIKIKNILWTLK